MTKEIILQGYSQLRNKVRQVLLLGQQKIEREKIKTYWQTGKLISEYILKDIQYAERGKEVVLRLSKDMNISERLLYQTIQFARAFPKVNSCSLSNLSWSHWRRLASIPDSERRDQLVKSAESNEWTAEELSTRLTKIRELEFRDSLNVNHKPLPIPILGPFWTYQIKDSESIHSKRSDILWVDLGFQVFLEAERFEARKIKANDVVTSTKDKDHTYSLRKSENITTDHLFTYKAYVERIIDGDTLKVQIDLGFDIWRRQTIRLRGIDSYEMDTREGKRAKEFVERELKNEPFVILKSTRDDKYGRYLGDIFCGESKYLNQKLLNERLAVRV